MPVYERRYYLELYRKANEKTLQQPTTQPVNTGKGKRTTSISGNALKSKMKQGEIPIS